jgi:site-specific DNA-methyltransferase (adenine-specific)
MLRIQSGLLNDSFRNNKQLKLRRSERRVIFADPPFNLGKHYGSKSDDELESDRYLNWCFEWLTECCRILKPGGSLFIYNLPKWNIPIGAYLLNGGLTFRHWIAIK